MLKVRAQNVGPIGKCGRKVRWRKEGGLEREQRLSRAGPSAHCLFAVVSEDLLETSGGEDWESGVRGVVAVSEGWT